MNASLISLIFTGIALLIVVSSIVFGIIRGFKKSLFRFCWLLGSAIILFLITPAVSNMLNSIDISSLNINIYGKVVRLSDIGLNLLNELAKSEPVIQNSHAMQSLAQNVPALIVNIFVYTILFWVVKWLLWPIWALISSHFFDKDKREEKLIKKQRKEQLENTNEQNQNEQNVPYVFISHKKKKRFLGAIFGFISGIILCVVTFCPIIGINNIYQKAYATLYTQKDGEKVSLINTTIEDKKALEFASSYENSIINKVFNYTGVNLMSNLIFDGLAVLDVNYQKVSLNQEIDTAIKVYNKYDAIANFNTNNLTQESLENVLTAVKEIFIDIEDSKILYLIGDDILPYYINKFISSDNFKLIDGARIDNMIVNSYKIYTKDFKLKDIKEQAESLVDVAMVLNNSNLIAPIANKQVKGFDGFASLVNANVKNYEDLSNTVVEKMYRVDMLKDNYPMLFNDILELVFEEFNINFVQQPANDFIMKEDFKSIFTNALSFFKYYGKSNNGDFGEDTAKAFINIGNVLDITKNKFFTINDNYNNLLNFILNEVDEITLKYGFSNLFDNATLIESWRNELSAIAGAYKNVVGLVNDKIDENKILDENYDKLEKLGNALDGAIRGNSKILTNDNIRNVLEVLLEKINNSKIKEILNIEVENGVSLSDYILNNIYNDDPSLENSSKITNWQNEIKYNLSLIRKVYPIAEKFSSKELSSEENTQLEEIGKELDIVVKNTKLAFNNDVVAKVLDYFISKSELPSEVKKILNLQGSKDTIYNEILANINSKNENLKWQDELKKIKGLLKVDYNEEEFDLINIGSCLDEVKGSEILTSVILHDIIASYIYDNTPSWDKKGNEALASARTKLINNLEYIESYAVEFEHIGNLIFIVQNYGVDLGDYIEEIGSTFNSICGFTSGSVASKVLNQELVNEFLIYYLNSHIDDILNSNDDKNLIEVVKQLENNFEYIQDYTFELSNLYNLVLASKNNYDANNDEINNLKDLGAVIDNALANNTQVITQEIIGNLIECFINEKIEEISDDELVVIVNKIKDNFKNTGIFVKSYESEFANLSNLFNITQSNDLQVIGQTLQDIRGNSSIINEDILNEFVLYFFDKNTNSYKEGEYKDVVSSMRTNIVSINEDTSKSYAIALSELNTIVDVINELSTLKSLEAFISNDNIGSSLDELEDLTIVCNKAITYDIASLIVQDLLSLVESYDSYKTGIENVLNSSQFDFYNYESNGYKYEGDYYYADLFTAIQEVLPDNI